MNFFVFYIFSNFELKCLDFAHEIMTSLSTLLPNSHGEIIYEPFFKKGLILFFFGLWPEFVLTSHNDLSAGLPKLHFALPEEDFMEWNFFLKVYTFSKLFWFGSNVFQKVCKKFHAKLSELLWTCRQDTVEQLDSLKKYL